MKTKLLLLFLLVLIYHSKIFSQNTPLTIRKTWDGPYDIKMIAAPNLQAVYLNDAKAAAKNLFADSVVSYKTMLMSGKGTLSINNAYKSGSPFLNADISLSAIACPDPNVPCTKGFTKDASSANVQCPDGKYTPVSVSKIVTMTYSDYDTDVKTFSSSMANLDISSCSEVQAAYLYWAGNFGSQSFTLEDSPLNTFDGTNAAQVFSVTKGTPAYKKVLFKVPGSVAYQPVTAISNIDGDNSYVCVADVTPMVKGVSGGEFWVANLPSYNLEGGGGSTSGWTLVVVFNSPLSPPHTISLFDGFQAINSGTFKQYELAINAPSTTNFKSTIGFACLDGENLADQLLSNGQPPEGLGFQTDAGGPLLSLNPYTDVSHVHKIWDKSGYPMNAAGSKSVDPCKGPLFSDWADGYDGISSSHISTYNTVTGKNGYEITRKPSMINTLGFDAHNILLPQNAIAANATKAFLTIYAGPQGGTLPFMAYISIERQQPKLAMTKTSDKNQTGLSTQITYTLSIKNDGNFISSGNDIIYDTLDPATRYVQGSLKATLKGNDVTSIFTVTSGASNDLLMNDGAIKLNAANPALNIKADSVLITFKVDVLPYNDPVANNLYANECKRTITNTAFIKYNIPGGALMSKSNANDCGIGSETKILLQDPIFSASIERVLIGPIDASAFRTDSVFKHLPSALLTKGETTPLGNLDIRIASDFTRVRPTDVFPVNGSEVKYLAIIEYNVAQAGTCQKIYEITYRFSQPPVFITDTTDVNCFGLANGALGISASYGVGNPGNRKIAYYVFKGTVANEANFIATKASALSTQALSTTLALQHPNLISGDYSIVAEDDQSAHYFFGYKIIQPLEINGTITSTNVCQGTAADVSLNNVAGGPSNTYQYAWEQSPDSATWTAYTGASNTTKTILPTLASKTFFRNVVTSGVCKDTFAIGVSVKSKPLVIPSNPKTICIGDSTVLSVTGANTYNWDQGVGAGNNITVKPTSTTTYLVTGTSNGCTDDSSVVITVNPKSQSTITITDPGKICSSDDFIITATAANTGPAPKYVWSIASQTTSDTTTVASVKKRWPLGTQQLKVSLLAGPGCFANSEHTLVLDVVGLSAGKTDTLKNVCFGQPLLSIASVEDAKGGTGVGTIVYQWQDSTNGSWKDISGANSKDYTPASVTGTEFFRRRAVNGTTRCDTGYARIVTYTKAAQVTGGKIGPNPRIAICANIIPSPFTNLTDPTNGNPNKLNNFTYAWKVSKDKINFTALPITAADGLTYTPSAPLTVADTTNFYFVRTSTDKNCGAANSDTIALKVFPVLKPQISIVDPGQICKLDKVTITTKSSNGGLSPKFTWTYNGAPNSQIGNKYTNVADWEINSVLKVTYSPSSDICSTGPVDTTFKLNIQDAVVPTVQLSVAPAAAVCSKTATAAFEFIAKPLNGKGTAPQYQFSITHNGVATIARAFATDLSFKSSNIFDGDSVYVVMKSNSNCATKPLSAPFGLKLNVVPLPNALVSQPLPACYPNKISLTAQGGIGNSQYQWFRDDVKISGANASIFNVSEEGINSYKVEITNTNAGVFCKGSSLPVVSNIENISVDAGLSQEVKFGDSIPLNGQRSHLYPVTWRSPASKITYVVDSMKPLAKPLVATWYHLSMKSLLTGCKVTDSTQVVVLLPIDIPNVFTPNSDGLNDTWVIKGIDTYPKNQVRIFNRWGNIVYEKDGYKNEEGWDGTTNGGSLLPVAVYYYVVDPKNDKGGGPYSSWITIVR